MDIFWYLFCIFSLHVSVIKSRGDRLRMLHVWNRGECIEGLVGGNLHIREYMEVPLMYLKETGTEDMDLILLAQETVKWRAAMNM